MNDVYPSNHVASFLFLPSSSSSLQSGYVDWVRLGPLLVAVGFYLRLILPVSALTLPNSMPREPGVVDSTVCGDNDIDPLERVDVPREMTYFNLGGISYNVISSRFTRTRSSQNSIASRAMVYPPCAAHA